MTKETDEIYAKFLKDNDQPAAVVGEIYLYDGVEYIYKEEAIPIIELVDTFPELINKENCIKILNDEPPKTTQTIDESVRQFLIQSLATNASTKGSTKPDIATLINASSAVSAATGLRGAAATLAGLSNISGIASKLGNPAGLAGAAPIIGALQNLPAAGLDKAMEAVKGQIKATEAKLPFKTGKASDITSKVNQVVQGVIPSDVKGADSLIFAIIRSNLMKGIPEGGTTNPSGGGSRLIDEAKKLVAAAPNQAAYVAQFNKMAREFPQVDINAVALQAAQMVKTGNPSAFASGFPNMMKLAGGVLKLLGMVAKHPDKLPEKERKTKPAPKPQPLVQPKNLFATAAGASTMNTLMGSVSALMGIVSTVAGNLGQMAPSPQLTSAGPQKLTGTANTSTWGSGQFDQTQSSQLALINKELELSTKIEELTAEILAEVDLDKITTKSMAQILEIYPQYNEGTTVLELYEAILEHEKKQSTMTA